jgi:hypothetical protein
MAALEAGACAGEQSEASERPKPRARVRGLPAGAGEQSEAGEPRRRE